MTPPTPPRRTPTRPAPAKGARAKASPHGFVATNRPANETPNGQAAGARAAPGPAQPDDTPKDQLRKLFEVWVDSEMKAQVVIFFNNNPGVVETVDGLARRLGLNAALLRDAVADHVRLGLLQERKLGEKTVLVFNRDRRNEIQNVVVDALQRRKESL